MESNHEQLEAMVVGRVESLENHEAGHCVLISDLRSRVAVLEWEIIFLCLVIGTLAYVISKMKGSNGN